MRKHASAWKSHMASTRSARLALLLRGKDPFNCSKVEFTTYSQFSFDLA